MYSQAHSVRCTEGFYQEQVLADVSNSQHEEDKRKILEMLERVQLDGKFSTSCVEQMEGYLNPVTDAVPFDEDADGDGDETLLQKAMGVYRGMLRVLEWV